MSEGSKRPLYDWVPIKADYVEGIPDGENTMWPTVPELAERHGVPLAAVRDHCASEGWVDERQAFQRRIEYERQELRAKEAARLGADLDVTALRIARNGLSIAAARITELGNRAQQRVAALRGNPDVEPSVPPVDSLELERLSRSADQWYSLGQRALGDTPKVRIEIEAAIEVDVAVRDQRDLGVMAILADAGVMDERLSEVIDLDSGRLQLVAGADADEGPPTADATIEPVHPADADDGQPEPQAAGLPADRGP